MRYIFIGMLSATPFGDVSLCAGGGGNEDFPGIGSAELELATVAGVAVTTGAVVGEGLLLVTSFLFTGAFVAIG